MERYLTWGLFILFTLGTVDFDVKYGDGLQFHYESWWDNFSDAIEDKVGKVC